GRGFDGSVADAEERGELPFHVGARSGTLSEAEVRERLPAADLVADVLLDEESGGEVDRVLALAAAAADVDREKAHLLRGDRSHVPRLQGERRNALVRGRNAGRIVHDGGISALKLDELLELPGRGAGVEGVFQRLASRLLVEGGIRKPKHVGS